MPTRDEMNSCGVPFLALRRPEAIEDERAAYAAGQARAINELTTKLVELGLRCQALEVAKRDAETRAGEWEMIAKLKRTQADIHRAAVLALTEEREERERLKAQLGELRGISKRLARENERLRQQVAMMADVQGPAACLGSAADAWQAALAAELSSVGGMAASMERVEVLGVEWDDASEKATEAREPAPSPLPEKIDFASHGATSQASWHISRCGCAGLGCDREH